MKKVIFPNLFIALTLIGCSSIPRAHQAVYLENLKLTKIDRAEKISGFFVCEMENGYFDKIILFPNGLTVSSFMRLPDCSDSSYVSPGVYACDSKVTSGTFYYGSAWGFYKVIGNRLERFTIYRLGMGATNRKILHYTFETPDLLVLERIEKLELATKNRVSEDRRVYKRVSDITLPEWEKAWILKESWFGKEFEKATN